MTESDKLRIQTYFTILDRMKNEMEKKCTAYINTFGRMTFWLPSPGEITKSSNKLQEFYNDVLKNPIMVNVFFFEHNLQNISKNIKGVIAFSKLLYRVIT